MSEFLSDSMTSRELLALLFLCESRRLKRDIKDKTEWEEILEAFAERFENLAEPARKEVLEAHLMSVEDVDIFDDATMRVLLKEHSNTIDELSAKLDGDPRFTT